MRNLMIRAGLGLGAAVLTIGGSAATAGATIPGHDDGSALAVEVDDDRTASIGVSVYAAALVRKAMGCPASAKRAIDCAYPDVG